MTEVFTPEERQNIWDNVCKKCKFNFACSYIHKREKSPSDCTYVTRFYSVFEPRCGICANLLHGFGTLTSMEDDSVVHVECLRMIEDDIRRDLEMTNPDW
jgi:hypothetical protein